MCKFQDLSLKELEDIRKICGEQEQYYHRSSSQALNSSNMKLHILMKAKSSTAKKLRMRVTDIIDNILENVVELAGEGNHE